MKYIIALFTSKVIREKNGRVIYVDPITKNGYVLKGTLAKQYNLLTMRFAVAIFAFLVLYSLFPRFENINLVFVWGITALIGLIIFEYRLYTKILPSCSIFPNYTIPANTEKYSDKRTITLLIAYALLFIMLIIYAIQEKSIEIAVGCLLLGIVVVIRLANLSLQFKNKKDSR